MKRAGTHKSNLAFIFFMMGLLLSSTLVLCGSQSSAASWWNDSIFYEVFVRSFFDSNGDGIGDLNGLTSHLDYLNAGQKKSLGVNAVWLMPVFKSNSYHGYDAVDYKSIEPAYGSLADFDRFVQAAHARKIRVVLDFALNHTSNKHPWFIASAQAPESPAGKMYDWARTKPDWQPEKWHALGGEFYYAFFGSPLPDLNWRNPDVVAAMKDIIRFWVGHGVDGFRLDAARYLVEGSQGEPDTPETHRVLHELLGWARAQYPEIYFVGEVWADATVIAPYVNGGDELNQAFNFPMAAGLVESLATFRNAPFGRSLIEVSQAIKSPTSLGNFLTNHDQVRVASIVNGSAAALKLGAVTLLTLPGTPYIYYGEELGMPNGGDVHTDFGKRTPMMWSEAANFGFTRSSVGPWQPFSTRSTAFTVATQARDPKSLLSTYAGLTQLRRREVTLHRGDFELLSSKNDIAFSFARRFGHELTLVFINFTHQNIETLEIATKPVSSSAASTQSTLIYGAEGYTYEIKGGQLKVQVQNLGGQQAKIIKFFQK